MVIWKGINFRDKGIIVEKKPTITKAKKILIFILFQVETVF